MQIKSNTRLKNTCRENRKGGRRILILGLGNILLSDEGFGVHISHSLQEKRLPDNVEVIDGGTASFDVLLLEQNVEKLIVIDALRAGKKPGTIYKARIGAERQDILRETFCDDTNLSLHQIGLIDALVAAKRLNCSPKEIVIIGVEPKRIDYGLELTDEVKKRVSEIIDIVLKEVEDVIHTE
jgi:hydrogenase maturation protease